MAGIALVIIGFDIVRARELSNLGDLGRLILLDLPIVAGLGLLLAVIFHFVGQLHRTLEKRNAELLALHEAALDIAGELDLETVLQRVVGREPASSSERATALSPSTTRPGRIERFLHQRHRRASTRQRIGPPPEGKGLLGAVLREGEVDPRAATCDRHRPVRRLPRRPPADAVAARRADRQPAALARQSLSRRQGGCAQSSTSDDERTLQRFAAQAALAIDTAHYAPPAA